MPISWNEIRHNAHSFAKDWADETSEDAEAKTFWDEFFGVFGVKRRTVASFEEPVKNLAGHWAYIDLFWPGTLLVEHKSRGKSLDKANTQAMEYIHGLKNAGRDDEIPRYIIVSDFARFALHDLEEDQTTLLDLTDLHKNVQVFAFIPGYKQQKLDSEDPVNVRAVELLGDLHDALEEGGYSGHDLERFLVRILFCLFADDTGIFERDAFALYIQIHTRADGSDLGVHLARLFEVLDREQNNRQGNLVEELAELPHVNGELFRERLNFAEFNRAMRDQLLRCTRFDWSQISPAVFGSLFQSVMQPKERRQVGAHYTSERDIMKVVRSLFLDDLRAEFEKVKRSKPKLKLFHEKLAALRFLDPACGCGNFLVVTYRELRLLEMDVLLAIHGKQKVNDIHMLSRVDVDAMHGIEINEFPARIAEVAMWLVDHQMNQKVSAAFGLYYVRLPLRKSAKIKHGNALRANWSELLAPADCSFVLGNPPFIGSRFQTPEQRADLKVVAGHVKGYGVLDYVTAWYFMAADYIKGTKIDVGFVSTNSITQGEQVGVLWPELFRRGMQIQFAHRTFAWQSEARGGAHVHVVIIGFGEGDRIAQKIHDYDSDPANPTVSDVKRISPYLVEAAELALAKRSKSICRVPVVSFGSMPNDDGFLLLNDTERTELLAKEPAAAQYLRRIMGSTEFINGISRWCLWLVDVTPNDLSAMRSVMHRVDNVRQARLASTRSMTKKLALTPAVFGEIRQPIKRYLGIPKTSSERRRFIPMDFVEPEVIAGSELFTSSDATLYHFGHLSSTMHMAWVKQVCGRMKSDYRYSVKLVYNNYPWPQSTTEKQRARVEEKAQAVLDARGLFPDATLAQLYDPLTMPPKLSKAHGELDRAVDACYRAQPFISDRARVEFLFELYVMLTAPITAGTEGKPKRKRSQKAAPTETD